MNKFLKSFDNSAVGSANTMQSVMPMALLALALIVIVVGGEALLAGTSAFFTGVDTEVESAVFGNLGKAFVAGAALVGVGFALLKGAWMYAGLGVAISFLFYITSIIINNGTAFGAMLPVAGM